MKKRRKDEKGKGRFDTYNVVRGNKSVFLLVCLVVQIYLGVAYTSANQGNTLVVDIGGASTEVIIGRDMQPLHLNSVDMGCVTFMERYFSGGIIDEDNSRPGPPAFKGSQILLCLMAFEF